MTNHHADGSIIEGIVGLHIEERILKNTSWETNLVGRRVVVGVDRLWRHVPFVPIHRLLPFTIQHIGMCPFCHLLHVLIERLLRIDVHLRIVTPLIRIAHFHIEGIQFLLSCFLRRFTHPFLRINVFTKSNLQILNEFFHTCFVGRWEILLHIHLTYSLTQDAVDSTDTALPTWTRFLGTRHDASLKVEYLFIHFITKNASSRIENLPLDPILQNLHRCVLQDSEGFLHRFGLTHRERVDVSKALHIKVSFPVEALIIFQELSERHLVIVRRRVTQCHIVATSLRHAHLHFQDVLHLLLGSLWFLAHQLEHLCHVPLICLQNLLVGLVILHIVIPFNGVTALRNL